jgi:hypothetical protein
LFLDSYKPAFGISQPSNRSPYSANQKLSTVFYKHLPPSLCLASQPDSRRGVDPSTVAETGAALRTSVADSKGEVRWHRPCR